MKIIPPSSRSTHTKFVPDTTSNYFSVIFSHLTYYMVLFILPNNHIFRYAISSRLSEEFFGKGSTVSCLWDWRKEWLHISKWKFVMYKNIRRVHLQEGMTLRWESAALDRKNALPQLGSSSTYTSISRRSKLTRLRSRYFPTVLSIPDHSGRVSSIFSSFEDRAYSSTLTLFFQQNRTWSASSGGDCDTG